MTLEALAAIAARNAARTQGKWLGMNMVNIDGSSMTAENIGEYVKNSVKKTAEVQKVERFLFVTIDGDNQPDICHVGNGPMGPHNAAFIAHASEDIPSLLAEVARLTAEKQEAYQRGYDAAKEQARGEAVRQGNVYRNNEKGASGLSASTIQEYRFAAAACDYVASAIAAMREAGGTPPIFALDLSTGGAAYKVKLGPSGNLVYEPVDLYETEKPEGEGQESEDGSV